jgi:hypothetical protein
MADLRLPKGTATSGGVPILQNKAAHGKECTPFSVNRIFSAGGNS